MSIIKNFTINNIFIIVNLLIGVLKISLIYKNLPTTLASVVFIFFSLESFFLITDFGLGTILTREYANRSISKYQSNIVIQIVAKVYRYLVVIVGVSGTLIGYLYISELKLGILSNYYVFHSWLIFLGGSLLNIYSNKYMASLIGINKIGLERKLRILCITTGFIYFVFVINMTNNLIVISSTWLFQNVLLLVSLAFYNKKYVPKISKDLVNIKFHELKNIIKLSTTLAITQVCGYMAFYINNLYIGKYIDVNEVSSYYPLLRIFTLLIQFAISFQFILFPKIVSLREDKKQAASFYLLSTKVGLCIIITMSMLFIINAENIFLIWLGKDYQVHYFVIIIFIFIAILEVNHSIAGSFTWSYGKWPFAVPSFFSAVINISLLIILGPIYGLEGVVISTLVAKLLTVNWYTIYKLHKNEKYDSRAYITVVLKIIGYLFIPLIVIAFVSLYVNINNMLDVNTTTIIATICVILFSITAIIKKIIYPHEIKQLVNG